MSAPACEPRPKMPFEVDGALATPAGNGHVRLKDCVGDALRRYFEALDGHECRDLFSLVMREVEEPLLEVVLAQSGGSRVKAAQMLGINRGTLRKKLQLYRLD